MAQTALSKPQSPLDLMFWFRATSRCVFVLCFCSLVSLCFCFKPCIKRRPSNLTPVQPEGDRQAVVADGFRSLLAAVTQDQSLKTAQAFCRDFLIPVLKNVDITEYLNLQYPRSALRRILQSQKLPGPELQ